MCPRAQQARIKKRGAFFFCHHSQVCSGLRPASHGLSTAKAPSLSIGSLGEGLYQRQGRIEKSNINRGGERFFYHSQVCSGLRPASHGLSTAKAPSLSIGSLLVDKKGTTRSEHQYGLPGRHQVLQDKVKYNKKKKRPATVRWASDWVTLQLKRLGTLSHDS